MRTTTTTTIIIGLLAGLSTTTAQTGSVFFDSSGYSPDTQRRLAAIASEPKRVLSQYSDYQLRHTKTEHPQWRDLSIEETVSLGETASRFVVTDGDTMLAMAAWIWIGPDWASVVVATVEDDDTSVAYSASLLDIRMIDFVRFENFTGDEWPDIALESHGGGRMWSYALFEWMNGDSLLQLRVHDSGHALVGYGLSFIEGAKGTIPQIVVGRESPLRIQHPVDGFDLHSVYYRYEDHGYRLDRSVMIRKDPPDTMIIWPEQ